MSRTKVLSTATVNYLELIANGKTYRVPPYQRDYAWTEEEWEDLWNDILDLRRQPEGRHYMGALVVHGQSDREFTIIDGQQRLATIGVLSLAVIAKRHRMADQKEETEAHRPSRARTRANTSAAGREEISPRRYASYLRIASSSQSCSTFSSKSSSKESIGVRANSAFCFGLSLLISSRSSEISRVIFVTLQGYRKVFGLLPGTA